MRVLKTLKQLVVFFFIGIATTWTKNREIFFNINETQVRDSLGCSEEVSTDRITPNNLFTGISIFPHTNHLDRKLYEQTRLEKTQQFYSSIQM